jgi:hypothetical protein
MHWHLGSFMRAGVTVACPLKCDPISGAVLTISPRQIRRRKVKWTRIEQYAEIWPSVDVLNAPIRQRKFILRKAPKLPAVKLEPEPKLPPNDLDYRYMAWIESSAGRSAGIS